MDEPCVAPGHRVEVLPASDFVDARHAEIPQRLVVAGTRGGIATQKPANVELREYVGVSDEVTSERRLEATQPAEQRVLKVVQALLFDVRETRTGQVADQMRGAPVDATDLLDCETPRLEKLRLLIVAAKLHRLEPAREYSRFESPVTAAMHSLPVVAEAAGRLRVNHVLAGQHHARTSTVAEERRPVNLARPREPDGVASQLDRHHAVHAVIAQPANVHDLVLRVDRLAARLLAILVSEPPVLDSLHLHAARMQRQELRRESSRPGSDLHVGVAVQAQVQHQLFAELERSLPPIRRHVQHAIERMLAGDTLPAVRLSPVQVQRQSRHAGRQHADARQDHRRTQRRLRVNSHARRVAVRPARRARFKIPVARVNVAGREPEDAG